MRPTRGYRAHLHNATVIDLRAEAMWPRSNSLDFTITTLVIGLPRTVVVQRCVRAEVDIVVRDDLAVWPPPGPQRRTVKVSAPSGMSWAE